MIWYTRCTKQSSATEHLLLHADKGKISSKALATISRTACCHNPKDRNFHCHCLENPHLMTELESSNGWGGGGSVMSVFLYSLEHNRAVLHHFISFVEWCESPFHSKAEHMNRAKLWGKNCCYHVFFGKLNYVSSSWERNKEYLACIKFSDVRNGLVMKSKLKVMCKYAFLGFVYSVRVSKHTKGTGVAGRIIWSFFLFFFCRS